MKLCTMLGIEIPIIQAPMAGVQNWQLAAAVSKAGGLGSIPCGMLSPEQVRTEIDHFIANCDRPYNLNFFCHSMPAVDEQALKNWQRELQHYYDSLAVSPPDKITGLRLPFDNRVADILEAYKPPIISFHFGLPAPDLAARVKSWGSVILSSATTREEGIWLQDHGADIVIAQGSEAGGHRAMFLTTDPATQITTAALVTVLVQELSVPIVAAGGIATRHDVTTILQQGASGVQIGTSYLLCDEAKTSQLHRQAIKSADETTALTNIFSGRLARGISNKIMQDLDFISDKAPAFPYASVAMAPLRAKAEALNKADFSPLWSGTNRQGCKEISAGELTRELWADAL